MASMAHITHKIADQSETLKKKVSLKQQKEKRKKENKGK